MKLSFISALAAATLLLSASLSFAVENTVTTTAEDASTSAESSRKSARAARAEMAAKRKANAKIKAVDINSASKQELMKLPSIGDAEADKIIAGRPFGSKAWLVTHNIIPEGLFLSIKTLIVANQPKDDAKNPVLQPHKK